MKNNVEGEIVFDETRALMEGNDDIFEWVDFYVCFTVSLENRN